MTKKGIKFQFPEATCHFQDSFLHSDSSPAIIDSNGTKIWMQYGRFHRENLPAVEFSNGHCQYYIYGKLHRINGPAIISDTNEWWITGFLLPSWVPKIENNTIYGEINNKIIYKVIIEIDLSYGLLLQKLSNKHEYYYEPT